MKDEGIWEKGRGVPVGRQEQERGKDERREGGSTVL